jgi:mannan endo-1,4-beta-mannosidase
MRKALSHRGARVAVALVAVAAVAVVAVVLLTSGGSEKEPTTRATAYWGAWIGSQLTGEEAPFDMGAVTAFEEQAGKAPSLVEFAQPFVHCLAGGCSTEFFPTAPFEAIRERGAIPFFSWSSQAIPAKRDEPEFQLADVVEGRYDGLIRRYAEAAKAWGYPFFLRFNWEMNGNWFAWAAAANGNDPGEYVAAWRHVHDIFSEVGATNATWVWCPYADSEGDLEPLAPLYPGNEYVDWTCLDVYNWGPSADPNRPWQSFAELAGPSYREITKEIAPGKPMIIGETASSEHGGSKAEWIAQMFADLPQRFPRIHGLIWFDKAEDMDWPIDTSPSARKSFARGIAGERYAGAEFADLAPGPIAPP